MAKQNGNPTTEMRPGLETGPAAAGTSAEATRPIEELLHQLGTRAVFGEPIASGAVTVIPVAEVRTGFGFGSGQGRSETPEPAEGGGFGGGGAGRVVPRGYIRITGEEVRFDPILDVTRLALASMALVGLVTFMLVGFFGRGR